VSQMTGIGANIAPESVFTVTPSVGIPSSARGVPSGLSVMANFVRTSVIVYRMPVTITSHSAVVYASVSSGVKITCRRFSPTKLTLPPYSPSNANLPGTTVSVPLTCATPPSSASSRNWVPTYVSAGRVGRVVMTVSEGPRFGQQSCPSALWVQPLTVQ